MSSDKTPTPFARYRRKELAAKMNVSLWFVKGMVAAGFKMSGGTATVEEANRWLKRNPNFSPTAAINDRKAAKENESFEAGLRDPQLSDEHKCGELLSRHG